MKLNTAIHRALMDMDANTIRMYAKLDRIEERLDNVDQELTAIRREIRAPWWEAAA